MSRDDEKTPAARPSALRIQQWGIVEAWLSDNDERFYVGKVLSKGHQVTVVNENGEERIEMVLLAEDVSNAILRAISRFL